MKAAAIAVLTLALGVVPTTACEPNDIPCVTAANADIADLEQQLHDARNKLGGEEPVACHMSESGQFVVAERDGGGFNVSYRNSTEPPRGVTRFNVYLAPGEDSELVLPNMFVHIFNTEEIPDVQVSFDKESVKDLLSDDGVIDSMFGTLMAIPVMCLCLALTIGLEAKFQCIGGGKLHHMIEEQKKVAEGIAELMELMGVAHHDGEEEMVDDPENPGQKKKKSPLENPVLKMLMTKALSHAGVEEHHTKMVVHTLKHFHENPKETISKLAEGGIVPQHMVDAAHAHAERAQSVAKEQAGKAKDMVKHEVDQTVFQLKESEAMGKVKQEVEKGQSKAGAAKGGKGQRKGKGAKKDDSMTAPGYPESKGDAKKRMKDARDNAKKSVKKKGGSFKVGGSLNVGLEYSNPMHGASSKANPMTDFDVVMAEPLEVAED